MTFWFLVLMAIYTPVIVVVASLTIVLIVIELATVFLYPVWVIMFDPSVFVIQWHTILFDMLVANIACNLVFPLFFVTWNAGAKHIRDKIRGNCITLFDTRMTLIALYFVFEVYLMGKF